MEKEVRRAVIERDGNECQLSKIFGIAHLSGVPCTEQKEVHHKTYENFNKEKPEDLITVCRRCHDVLTSYIRGLRYFENAELKLDDTETSLSTVSPERPRNEDIELPDYGSQPIDNAQRTTRRLLKRRFDPNLKDSKKASENRRRFGRDGEA